MKNRTLSWTTLMAILGLILGLGFFVPLPSDSPRSPASNVAEVEFSFLQPNWVPDSLPAGTSDPSDPRPDVLFDIHTVSRSRFAKNTDAYVTTRFTNSNRDQIERLTYCHNYDYSQQAARTDLNRYSLGKNAFNCYEIPLDYLAEGYGLINTPFGIVLTLKSKPGFDPRKGGTISVIFAYKIAKFGSNDYRELNLKIALVAGNVKITGPKNEAFDWLNLKMTEDFFTLPNGVNSFDLFLRSTRISTYMGNTFPKVPNPSP